MSNIFCDACKNNKENCYELRKIKKCPFLPSRLVDAYAYGGDRCGLYKAQNTTKKVNEKPIVQVNVRKGIVAESLDDCVDPINKYVNKAASDENIKDN